MAALDTSSVVLPQEVSEMLLTKISDHSVVQRLSTLTPTMFKGQAYNLFTQEPEAEFVDEGAQKSSMTPEIGQAFTSLHKAQVTVRMSDELRWSDEDNRMQIVSQIVSSGSRALGRALDYGVLYGVSPATGTQMNNPSCIIDPSMQTVTATSDPAADLDALVEMVNEDYEINGIALSKPWANELRKKRDPNTGLRWFPEVPLNLNTGNLEGIPAATSSTVNGTKVAQSVTLPRALAIVGNWDLVKWGVARNLGLDIIETGDPDGLGDLKRLNQVAYRLEIVYAWAILDSDGFAALVPHQG